jgi:hypothetical protein
MGGGKIEGRDTNMDRSIAAKMQVDLRLGINEACQTNGAKRSSPELIPHL